MIQNANTANFCASRVVSLVWKTGQTGEISAGVVVNIVNLAQKMLFKTRRAANAPKHWEYAYQPQHANVPTSKLESLTTSAIRIRMCANRMPASYVARNCAVYKTFQARDRWIK